MQARICYEGFDEEESGKLKSFLPVGDYFAKRWNMPIMFDAPHGVEISHDTNDKQNIHVHFFASPPPPTPRWRKPGYAKELFFLDVPYEEMIIAGWGAAANVSGNDVASRIKAANNYTTIRSPEGRAVAQVAKNHIYILLDLAHRPWKGAEPVLWEIFERAEPYLSLGDKDDLLRLKYLTNAHRYLQRKVLRKKKSFGNDFKAASRFVLEKAHSFNVSLMGEKKAETAELERDLMNFEVEIEMIKYLLGDSERDSEVSRKNLAQEFELIHGYEGLLGIKVEGGKLCVFTEPIKHFEPGKDTPQITSQYKIIIDPNQTLENTGSTMTSIKMKEWGWRGPYQHPESYIKDTYYKEERSPCFGQSFVQDVKKAFLDQDYKILIALLLHYLDSDGRSYPLQTSDLDSQGLYRPEPFYLTPEDKIQAREDYVNFMRNSKGASRRKKMETELAKNEEKKQEGNRRWLENRKSLSFLGAKFAILRLLLNNLPLEKEMDDLFNSPAFLNVKIGQDFFWCVFGPGKGHGNFGKVWFDGTIRVLVNVETCEMSIFFGPSSGSSLLPDRLDQLGKMKKAAFPLKSYFAKGFYGKALVLAYNILRGGEFYEEKTTEAGKDTASLIENATVEEIAKWVKEKFPFC